MILRLLSHLVYIYLFDLCFVQMERKNWLALFKGGIDAYVSCMSKKGTWGDGVMIEAAGLLYRRPILVVPSSSNGQEFQHIETGSHQSNKPIILGYCNVQSSVRNHYVSLVMMTDMTVNEKKKTKKPGQVTYSA